MDKYTYFRNLAEDIAKTIAAESEFEPNNGLTKRYSGVRDDVPYEARSYKSDIEVRFPGMNVKIGQYEWFGFKVEHLKIFYGGQNAR